MELANGGTLFLDEVGNIPPALQSKLLSAIQNREIIPIGSNTPVAIDIRLVSATNSNLHEAVATSQFREDLLYRINTVEITLPPLRQRTDDIPILANHFLNIYKAKYRKEKTIAPETLKYIQKYSWPGNVRELQHAIERAVIMSEHSELAPRDFLFSSRKEADKKEVINLDEMEKNAITIAIRKYQGNMSKVSKELGIGRTTLYRKMTKYGLSNPEQN
jgi:two-component system response regulator HydG